MFKRVTAALATGAVLVGMVVVAPMSAQADQIGPTFSINVGVNAPPFEGEGSAPYLSTSLSVYTLRGTKIEPDDYGRLSGLVAGKYLVKVDASAPYSDAWYGDTPYETRAEPVEITDHDVTIDVTVGWAGTLSGHVTAAGGGAVNGGYAMAFLHDPVAGGYEFAGWGIADASSAYSIDVAPGSYVVRGGQHPINSGYVIPEYGDRLYGGGTTVEVGEKQTVDTLDVGLTPWISTTDRIAGDNRFSTAVQASQAAFSPGVPVVYITNGLNWPDALSAGPAAAHDGGPLLLTEPTSIPASLDAELRRLQPQRIVVVGGPNSVSDQVLSQLGGYSPSVHRIGGADRYEVSRAVSTEVFGRWVPSRTMLMATGANFPDALSAGAVASLSDAPVVLLNTGAYGIDDPTRQFLGQNIFTHLSVVGGPNSVSAGFVDQLGHFTKWGGAGRYDGADRFAVNRTLNGDGAGSYPTPVWQQTAYLVNGRNFPDALSATTLAGAQGARVFLAEANCVPQATIDLLRGSNINHLVLVGGPSSLSDAVAHLQPC